MSIHASQAPTIDAVADRQRRLEEFHADLQALAVRQDGMPSPGQVHVLIRQHGLASVPLDALLDALCDAGGPTAARRATTATGAADGGDALAPGPMPRSTAAVPNSGLADASAQNRLRQPPIAATPASLLRDAPVETRTPGLDFPTPTPEARIVPPPLADSNEQPPPLRSDDVDAAGSVLGPVNADDWNDADPFAVDGRESRPDDPPMFAETSNSAVARAAVDLLNDLARSGDLTWLDVIGTAHIRGLDPSQVEELLLSLAADGVEVQSQPAPELRDGASDLDGGRVRRAPGSAVRDQLGAYMTAAGRYQLLTPFQEIELGRAIQAGRRAAALEASIGPGGLDTPNFTKAFDTAHQEERAAAEEQRRRVVEEGRRARDTLVCANLRLVVAVARLPRYTYCDVDLAERVQEGNLGLMRAADRYDPELGYRFSTYASWVVHQAIYSGVAALGRTIRLPEGVIKKRNRIGRARTHLRDRLGHEPSVAEIAAEAGLDAGEVAAVTTWSTPIASLDAGVGGDGSVTLFDLLRAEQTADVYADPARVVEADHLLREVHRAVAQLLEGVVKPGG